MQAACRVEHQHVITLKLRGLHRAAGDFDWLLTLHDGKRRYIRLRPERRKLLLRRRAINVERRHQNLFAFLRSEEHTSELQSLLRSTYAVFCLKKKKYII